MSFGAVPKRRWIVGLVQRLGPVLAGLAALGLLSIRPEIAHAQPKVGLALSGGGARGFAHIGVLRVLEEEDVEISTITGASIGSIIGGLYAIGYSPGELEQLALSEDWASLFAIDTPRRRRPVLRRVLDDEFILKLAIRDGRPALPSSLVSGQAVSMLLSRLTLPYHEVGDFDRFPISFAAVATDLETGEAVVLDHGHLAEALRASIAIPSGLAPVDIGGRSLIDGGIARNLPAEDAARMGADVIVCINTSRELQHPADLQSMTDVLNQAVSFRIADNVTEQAKLCDVYIEPELDDHDSFDFSGLEQIIEAGYAAADSMREAIRMLARQSDAQRDKPEARVEPVKDAYHIGEVRVEGVNTRQQRRIRSVLGFSLPAELTVSDIESAVDLVYSSGPNRQVSYRVIPMDAADGHALIIDASDQKDGELGVSLRFDSRYKASILISAVTNFHVGYGPTLRAALRLGEIPRLQATLIRPLTYGRRFTFRAVSEAARLPIDAFVDGRRRTQARVGALTVHAGLGTVLFGNSAITGGVRAEYFDIDRRIGFRSDADDGRSLIGPEASIRLNTRDRDVFPQRGHEVNVHGIAAVDPVEGGTFSRLFFDWEARWRAAERVSLIGRFSVGAASGDIPLHYGFFLGGPFDQPVFDDRLIPLIGASTQELQGSYMQALSLGVQLQLREGWITTVRWNAGWAAAEWDWLPGDFRPGLGVSMGRQIFTVPFVVTVGTRGPSGPYGVWINLGYVF